MKECRPSTYFTRNIWTSGVSRRFPRLLELTTQACQFTSTQCTVVSFPAVRNTQYPRNLHCAKFTANARFKRCVGPLRYTHEKQSFNFLDMQLWTLLMSWFSFVWLAYSGNKFFRVGPNISEKFVPGGTNFRGVQIKRDNITRNQIVN